GRQALREESFRRSLGDDADQPRWPGARAGDRTRGLAPAPAERLRLPAARRDAAVLGGLPGVARPGAGFRQPGAARYPRAQSAAVRLRPQAPAALERQGTFEQRLRDAVVLRVSLAPGP